MPSDTRSYPRRVVGGLATYLAAQGAASWDEFGQGTAYTTDTAWPIYIGPDMPTSPDRLIVLTPGVQAHRGADILSSVQIRLRGLPDDENGSHGDEVADKAQQIHDILYPNGFPLVHVAMGDIRVGAVFPGDALPLDPDGSRRHGSIQNFRLRTRRVGPSIITPPDGYMGGDEEGYE